MDEKKIEEEFLNWWLHTPFDFMPAIQEAMKQSYLAGRRKGLPTEKELSEYIKSNLHPNEIFERSAIFRFYDWLKERESK